VKNLFILSVFAGLGLHVVVAFNRFFTKPSKWVISFNRLFMELKYGFLQFDDSFPILKKSKKLKINNKKLY
jgi:hypothetical protein